MVSLSQIPQIKNLNDEERKLFYTLLSASKNSASLDLSPIEKLYKVDYDEIPVTIDEFLENDRYLGQVYDNGKNIYPYWRKFLHNFFHENPDKAFEVALTGAIGVGKTTIASIALIYLMYKTLCLRDPQKFYGLSANSPIVFVVMNLTLDLAYQGLYSLIVEAIKLSPWFCERIDIRGKYEFSIEFPKNIALMAGSQTTHTIGKNVLGACLTGDTRVLTTEGTFRLDEIEGKQKVFYTLSDSGILETSVPALVKRTKEVTSMIKLELEDGTTIECTPDHKFLLTTGEYKEAQYLTLEDEIKDVEI